jgi:hypothetical protein
VRPTIMSYQDWLTRTDVQTWNGRSKKDRSGPLATVDQLLQAYHAKPSPALLRNLQQALTTWVTSKTRANGTLNTMRNHATVTTLQQQILQARTFAEPTPWDAVNYPSIFIANDMYNGDHWVPDNFRRSVTDDLAKIIEKPKGKALLKAISAAGKTVVIQYNGNIGGNQCAPIDRPITPEVRRNIDELGGVSVSQLITNPNIVATGIRTVSGKKEFIRNVGANVIVKMNPADPGEKGDDRDSFIGLAHELVHCYHFVYGECARSPTGGTTGNQGGAEEEMRTIGVLAYAGEEPSENAIRAEWNMKLRTAYSGYNFKDTKATLFQ